MNEHLLERRERLGCPTCNRLAPCEHDKIRIEPKEVKEIVPGLYVRNGGDQTLIVEGTEDQVKIVE